MATDVPHENQEGCIAALNAEISRTRKVLERVTERLPARHAAERDEEPPSQP